MTITVELRPSTGSTKVRAWADVTIELPEGSLKLYGFSIVETNGKPPFCKLPK